MKTAGVSAPGTLVVIGVSQTAEYTALVEWCRSLGLEAVTLAHEYQFFAPLGRPCLCIVEQIPRATDCLLLSRMVDRFILFIVDEGTSIPPVSTPETVPPHFDYLRRPFGATELLWRAGWGLSQLSFSCAQEPVATTEAWRCGPIRYDLSAREVKVRGARLELRPAERALLAYLLRNHHRCVTASEIVKEVLHSSGDGAAARNQIYELRRKLRAAGVPEVISTEGRSGYRMIWTHDSAGLGDCADSDAGDGSNAR